MIPVLVGVALVALGVHRARRHLPPRDAARLPGTIVAVDSTPSRKNRRRQLHRPTVAVDHPVTGRTVRFDAAEFDSGTYRPGAVVPVAYVADEDRFVLAARQPVRQRLLLPVAGAAVIGLQVLDWLG